MKRIFWNFVLFVSFVVSCSLTACGIDDDLDQDHNQDHEYVDLGLPSGTLWATCNIGATKPEGYGDYFAWGETVPNVEYKPGWYGVEYAELQSKGVIDANGNLTATYDAATANWGNSWRMPTTKEIEELLTLKNEYAVVNGVKGRKFIGNGNSLFLPFADVRYKDEPIYVGETGYYWSATVSNEVREAYCLRMGSDVAARYFYYRDYGFPIRPVKK